jgi:hypothetical protein
MNCENRLVVRMKYLWWQISVNKLQMTNKYQMQKNQNYQIGRKLKRYLYSPGDRESTGEVSMEIKIQINRNSTLLLH